MKKLLLLCAICCYALTAAAQSTVHTVQRGETLASIAKQYHLSVDELKAANPYIGKKLYVGIKLQIPEVKEAPRVEEVAAATPVKEKKQKAQAKQEKERDVVAKPVKEKKVKNADKSLSDKPTKSVADRFSFAFYGGLSINSWVGDYCDANVESPNKNEFKPSFGFHVGAKTAYQIYKGFFAEINVIYGTKGYKQEQFITSGSGWDDEGANYDSSSKTTLKSYTLDVPLFLGYKHQFSNTTSMAFKVGPYMGYTLSGKKKTSTVTEYFDSIHSSEIDRDTETTDYKDISNYEELIFGVAGGVEVRHKNYFIGATYQRGLTEQIGKLEKKPYEQNLLISVGLIF